MVPDLSSADMKRGHTGCQARGLSLRDDRVAQGPDTLDLGLDDVPRPQVRAVCALFDRRSGRCARGDHVARAERHEPGDELGALREARDHLRRRSLLAPLTVDARLHAEVVRVEAFVDDDARSECVAAVEVLLQEVWEALDPVATADAEMRGRGC